MCAENAWAARRHSALSTPGLCIAIIQSAALGPEADVRCESRREDLAVSAMENDESFRQIVHDHGRFALGQIAQTAACNRLHHLEERCCRWLLIAHDSALSDTFPLTHEFLAMMLGVQRAGVSVYLSLLKKAGLIEQRRGQITITNRAGLEDAACECYRAMRQELDLLFGPYKNDPFCSESNRA